MNAPADGVLGEQLAKEGQTVEVNAVLGSITEGGAAPAPAAPQKAQAAAPAKPAQTPAKAAAPAPAAASPAPAAASAAPAPAASKGNGPAVERIAAETAVDPSGVAGTGKDGRVTKGDMLGALAAASARPVPAEPLRLRPCCSVPRRRPTTPRGRSACA